MSDAVSGHLETAFDPWRDPALPLAAARRIDEISQQFERAWQAGGTPAIESRLDGFSGLERGALLRELLSLDIEYRRRNGQVVAEDDYARRFPDDLPLVTLALADAPETASGDDSSETDGIPAGLVEHSRYRIVRLLGRGGMGTVYLAEHRVLHRSVALKVIKPEFLARPEVVERFQREASAAARLQHPNIVAAYDAETSGETHFLAMEFVAGADLARVVKERGPLPVAEACGYIRQAAWGLEHARQQGMVHRDIGPRNLMLAEDGRIKILDFGLARFASELEPAGQLTGEGAVLGSLDFMAPEQADDPRRADIRADIYGLGCTLYYLLAGQVPFADRSAVAKLKAHAALPPPALSELRADVPSELTVILARMLAKNPAERFQTPDEVAQALGPFAGNELPPSTTPGKSSSTVERWLSRIGVKRVVALAVLGLALIAGLTVFTATHFHWWTPGQQQPVIASPPDEFKQAYDEAVFLLGKRQERPARDAIKRLTDLTTRFPEFAPGHAALADAYNLCGDYGWEPANEVFPRAKSAAREALRLDPNLASAHLALAFSLHAHDCDWSAAEVEYRRALEIDPRSSTAHHWYAWFLVEQRRLDEAERHIDEAQRLSPVDLIVVDNVGSIRYYCREYAVAIEKHRHTLELDPSFRVAHYHLGLALAELGRLDEALAEFDLASGMTEGDRDLQAAHAYALARNGRSEDARPMLAALEASSSSAAMAYELAVVRAALGDRDEAFAWLGKALAQQSAARSKLKVDPRLDRLRSDTRFKQFLRHIGLGD